MEKMSIAMFDQMFHIMEASFPLEERRTYVEQRALLYREDYHVLCEVEGDVLLCFIAYYQRNDFCFMEHFATLPEKRGHGVGTTLLHAFFKQCSTILLFEVNPATTTAAKRRILFYKRQGCTLYPHISYQQPSFYEGREGVCLWLMSWPRQISDAMLQRYIHAIYQDIYHTA